MTEERGQALVEFALVLPVLLAMMFVVVTVVEIGLERLALEHGASEGARSGSLNNDDRLIRGAVAATVHPLDPARVNVSIEPEATGRTRGALLTVRLSYQHPLPLAFVGMSRLTLTSSATRLIEWFP